MIKYRHSIRTILNKYIRPGAEQECGCISDGARREFLVSFAELVQMEATSNTSSQQSPSHRSSRIMEILRLPSPFGVVSTINVRKLFARIKGEVERDIIGNPDLRNIIDRMLFEEFETTVHQFRSNTSTPF